MIFLALPFMRRGLFMGFLRAEQTSYIRMRNSNPNFYRFYDKTFAVLTFTNEI
jgi:hypothetical protein